MICSCSQNIPIINTLPIAIQGTEYFTITVLPQIMAQVFISFQQFLTRPLNEIDDYYRKKHMLFIICDASDEFLMETDDT